MSISKARFNQIFNGQSSSAKKVYSAVPIAEGWNARQITTELIRNGVGIDKRVISGCLDTLVDAGLVNELIRGDFRRVHVKEEELNQQQPELKEMTKPKANTANQIKQPKSPMDLIGDLASRASVIGDMLKSLSSDIGDVAIEIQQHIETSDADTQKFKQLQSLLKSIT